MLEGLFPFLLLLVQLHNHHLLHKVMKLATENEENLSDNSYACCSHCSSSVILGNFILFFFFLLISSNHCRRVLSLNFNLPCDVSPLGRIIYAARNESEDKRLREEIFARSKNPCASSSSDSFIIFQSLFTSSFSFSDLTMRILIRRKRILKSRTSHRCLSSV
jgi:hypothetical protein